MDPERWWGKSLVKTKQNYDDDDKQKTMGWV